MKIVFLVSRVPYPLEKGDKLRVFHQLTRLSANHDITLIALNDSNLHPKALDELKPYCKAIHIIKITKLSIVFNFIKSLIHRKPFQVAYFYNSKAKRKIEKIIHNEKPDLIYCQLVRVAEYVRHLKEYPKVLDYMDVMSKNIKRRIKRAQMILKPFLHLEYTRLKRYEHQVFEEFDACTIISKQDRTLIPHPHNFEIEIIPNGVDSNYYKPQPLVSKKYDLLFSGNMSYPPNVNSAIFLVKNILPLVHEKYPDVSVLIAGTKPARWVRSLASDKVTITGWVEDIRTAYAQSRLFVAPMQMGTGLQNKLLEAMAMQMPCVTSPLSQKALGATDKEEVLVAVSAEEYAEHIIHLLEHPDSAERLAKKGNNFVKEYYNWDKVNSRLELTFQIAQKYHLQQRTGKVS